MWYDHNVDEIIWNIFIKISNRNGFHVIYHRHLVNERLFSHRQNFSNSTLISQVKIIMFIYQRQTMLIYVFFDYRRAHNYVKVSNCRPI